MIYKTCYWDSATKQQLERDCTPAEITEIEQRKLPKAPTVPTQILTVQARLALEDAGLLDTVNATLDAMTGKAGKAARIRWQFAGELKRDQSAVLGLTPAQLDAVFIAGAKL